MTFLVVVALVLLALLGTPLFIIIGFAAIVGFYSTGNPIAIVTQETWRLATAPTFLAIPLFAFAGYLLAESGAPRRLVRASSAFVGWLPGGLAVVCIITCAILTALTGASGITIVAIGGLLMPALRKEKYTERFSLGIITSTGSIGLLFPPSLPIILYSVIATDVKVEDLFRAALVPGVFLVTIVSIFAITHARLLQKIRAKKFHWENIGRALWEAKWEVPIPIFIIGAIYGGFVTATEAAGVTAIYVLLVEVFLYRDIPLKKVPDIMIESMTLVGGILVILAMALGFTNVLVDQEVPQRLMQYMQERVDSPLVFLMLLNGFLLIVGCLMDIFSAIVIVIPIISTVAAAFGIHPLHLGVIFMMNLEIGYMTPPVGLNLFISSFRFQKPVFSLYRATLPFLLVMLFALLIITYRPNWVIFPNSLIQPPNVETTSPKVETTATP